jgi:formylglycine-generating enzyme
MISIPGGEFVMGSNRFYPEEAPAHRVRVDGFVIDRFPVTNREFAAFVVETHYVTVAEIAPEATDYPGALPEMLYAGSLLFAPPEGDFDPQDWNAWWQFGRGADWRHPNGAESNLEGLGDHPVVHIACADAEAYAAWAGKALPSEAQWEYAARGGLADADYAWGEVLAPEGKMLANYWQGAFPAENLLLDGFARISPVGSFPANGYGLCDMIGNVWEWTSDWWQSRHAADETKACCVPTNPRGADQADSIDPEAGIPRRVLKGGSHLCAENYCERYRPAARIPQTVDTSACHIGFRCVRALS